MNRILVLGLAIVVIQFRSLAQPIPIFENFGEINGAPQIDAIAFVNYGTFTALTQLPYDFENTRFFTNRGVMIGSVGFEFATAFSLGPKQRAQAFFNATGARVSANDLPASLLLIDADTIQNFGLLSAGNNGLLSLRGSNVNVSRSGLEIRPIESFAFSTLTSFSPDFGLYDLHWAMTNTDLTLPPSLTGAAAITGVSVPAYAATNLSVELGQFPIFNNISLRNPLVFASTNKLSDTNYIVQAVFVSLADTNITADARFLNSTIPTNMYKTAIVELSMLDTNVITGDQEFIRLYLTDQLASYTNIVILTNLATLAPFTTGRPGSYDLVRTAPPAWDTATAGNGTITSASYSNFSTNQFVTNFYSAYQVEVDSQASRPPQIPGFEATDLPGRVEIEADTLNLDHTRIRGSGLVRIQTANILSTSKAILDTENVSVTFAVPEGKLTVQDLIKEEARRLNGILTAWSGVWTNQAKFAFTNIAPDPMNPGVNTTNLVQVDVGFHFMVVDGTGLRSSKPVVTHDLVLQGPEVSFDDTALVARSFIVDSEHFTLNGRIRLTDRLTDFRGTNAPILRFFTNNGSLLIPNTADFGHDRTNAYASVVNNGLIAGTGILFRSDYFQNSGTITASADGITIDSPLVVLQNGNAQAQTDIRITADDLKMLNYTNLSAGTLELNVTGMLTDTGEPESNFWFTRRGFHLNARPTGDLLGTTVHTIVPRFRAVDHTWAGEDRGATVAGFSDNLVLGGLILDGDRDGLLRFHGLQAGSALYVAFLSLTNSVLSAFESGDLAAALEIDPNMVIYFADASVPPDELNGLLADAAAPEGRLRWVPDLVGGLGMVSVSSRASGGMVQMKRTLRESITADSDSDGIVNALDAYPLDADSLALSVQRSSTGITAGFLKLSWVADVRSSYALEFTTDLTSGAWQTVRSYTNGTARPQTAIFEEPIPENEPQRYYRIRLSP